MILLDFHIFYHSSFSARRRAQQAKVLLASSTMVEVVSKMAAATHQPFNFAIRTSK
jgi:hypothetical protein